MSKTVLTEYTDTTGNIICETCGGKCVKNGHPCKKCGGRGVKTLSE